MKDALRPLYRQVMDLLELILIPGFCALLPLSMTDRAVGFFARWGRLYNRQVHPGDPHLPGRSWDKPGLRARRRLYLTDYRDNYLYALRRLDRYMARYVDVRGEWPTQGGFVAVGLHWGPSMPMLRSLVHAGHRPRLVYRPERATDHPGWSIDKRFHRWHIRLLQDMCEHRAIRVGGAMGPIREALANRDVPILVPDAPSEDGWQTRTFPAGRHQVRLIKGTIRLLASTQTPFVMYRCFPRDDWRRRTLELRPVIQTGDEAAIGTAVSEFLVESLLERPELYFIWPHVRLVVDWPGPGA